MGLIETAEIFFVLEKCMILVSVDGFVPVSSKISKRKGFFQEGKTTIKHVKICPLDETANPQSHKWRVSYQCYLINRECNFETECVSHIGKPSESARCIICNRFTTCNILE